MLPPFDVKTTCAACRARAQHPQIWPTVYAPVLHVVVLGALGAWLLDLSRKRRFRCRSCGEVFAARSIAGRVALGVLVLIVLLIFAGFILPFFAAVEYE